MLVILQEYLIIKQIIVTTLEIWRNDIDPLLSPNLKNDTTPQEIF